MGHLARHHKQELEAAGVKLNRARGTGKGSGKGRRLVGKFRGGSGPSNRGARRSIRAMVNCQETYYHIIDNGDGTEDWYVDGDDYDTVSPVPIMNVMPSIAEYDEQLPTYYTASELDEMEAEAEEFEAGLAMPPTIVVLPVTPQQSTDNVSEASTVAVGTVPPPQPQQALPKFNP